MSNKKILKASVLYASIEFACHFKRRKLFLLLSSLIRKVNDSVKRKITKSIKIAIDTKIEETLSSHAKLFYLLHFENFVAGRKMAKRSFLLIDKNRQKFHIHCQLLRYYYFLKF